MDYLYFTPVIFFVIAFIFSMLGMGGSQLYIPILYWLGMDFKAEAIPLGMLLNVINSSSAAFVYTRKKLIDWRIAVPFGICMIIFAPIGTSVNVHLPTKPIIMIFAIFTAAAAVLMLSGWKPKTQLSGRVRIIIGLIAGSFLGFMAGLIGRGGGSFVVPLLYILGLDPKIAAATSSIVVTCSGTSSFFSHILTAARPRWTIWLGCAVSVFIGSQLGSRFMVAKLKGRGVKVAFGIILLIVAILLIVK